MKESLWGYWLIVLGIFVITVLLLIQNLTSQNTQDYYAVKEITEASIIDAIDYGYYEKYGEIRIVKERFIESFLERFSESANLSNTYKVTFYDIYEAPPKVSLKVSSKSAGFNIVGETSTFDVVNNIDMILETSPEISNGQHGKYTGKCVNCAIVTVKRESGSSTTPEKFEPGIESYSKYSIISDETDPELCQNIIAVFNTDNQNVNLAYKSFTCRNYDNKSDGCTIVFPNVLKSSFNVEGWEAPDGKVYKPGTSLKINENTTFYLKTTPSKSNQMKIATHINDVATSNITPIDISSSDANPKNNSGKNGQATGMNKCLQDDNGNNVGFSDTSLRGMRATPVVNLTLYKTEWYSGNNGSLTPGTVIYILGNVGSAWRVYNPLSDMCGYVKPEYSAISGVDYLGNLVRFDIYNAYSAQYKFYSNGSYVDIANVTGRQLYSNDYASFVPITYPFAQMIKGVAQTALNNGDKLVINDAYRPYSVSRYIFNTARSAAANSDVNGNLTWFLAGSVSKHNTGCAIDVTLEGASMPTPMHALAMAASKYRYFNSNSGFASTMTSDAMKLHNYFMNAQGFSDLASEWWHYQSNSCHNTIVGVSSTGASFWSNV